MKIQPSTRRIPVLIGAAILQVILIAGVFITERIVGWKLFPIAIPLTALTIAVVVYGIELFLRHMMESMSVEDRQLTIQQGIFSSSKSLVQLAYVKNIKVTQTFMQRIFGTGNLTFYTTATSATPGDIIEFKEIANPIMIQEQIWQHTIGTRPQAQVTVIPFAQAVLN